MIGSIVELCLFGLREVGEMNPTPRNLFKIAVFYRKNVIPDLLLWSSLPVTWMCPPGLPGIWKSSLLVMPNSSQLLKEEQNRTISQN